MGMENDMMLSYLEDNERFADTINFGFFKGEPVVLANELIDSSETYRPTIQEICNLATQSGEMESPSTETLSSSADIKSRNNPKRTQKKQKAISRHRDIKKTLYTGQSLKIVAIESQSDINYLMPWRHMDYDSREYGKQIQRIIQIHEQEYKAGAKDVYRTHGEFLSKFRADDQLNPAFTLCVYHGIAPWDGPRTLKDMMNFGTENPRKWEQIFADYPLWIICLNEIEDFSGFHSSVKELFRLLPYREDKGRLQEIITNTPSYQSMDEDTAGAISYMIGIDTFTENKEKYKNEGGYDMCKALREWAEDSKMEGVTMTAKVFKYLLANPTATNENIAYVCDCSLTDVETVRTALGI